jgi:hypothetical protein
MTVTFVVVSISDDAPLPTGNYPKTLSQAQYDELRQAIGVVDALWYLEESYDVLLQNAIELETAVARLEASQRANVSSFPDEVDLEVRLLNRLLINFLASARAFVDSIQARLSNAGEPLAAKRTDLTAYFSEQFDAEFSYRLMEALRNHSQHRAAPIAQTLTMIRAWQSHGESKPVLSVSPQIERDALVDDNKVNSKTRKELAQVCVPMIDLIPHLATYVRCFGKVVEKARLLYQPEYDAALATHTALLKDHLIGEWASVLVASDENGKWTDTLVTGAYELRRLERIRLRNVARDPVSA